MSITINVPEISLFDLQNFAEKDGLVGEKETFILFTLASLIKMPVMIYSFSGSGKTEVAKRWKKLIPSDMVYTLEMSSDTVITYDCAEINTKDFIFIPEFQLAMNSNNPIVMEVVKKVTEGEDTNRRVTNRGSKGIEKYSIKGSIGVVSTFAIENRTAKFDTETRRRIPILPTDISAEQTERVIDKIFSSDWDNGVQGQDEVDKSELISNYLVHLIKSDVKLGNILNPFMVSFTKMVPKDIRGRSYARHLSNFMKSCVKFHIKKRVSVKKGKRTYHLANISDVFNIYNLYWKNFVRGVLGIPMLGEEILKVFDYVEVISDTKPIGVKKSSLNGYMEGGNGENHRLCLRVTDVHLMLKKRKMSVSYNGQCSLCKYDQSRHVP